MKKAFIAIASILAIVAGCAKNNIEEVAESKITATIESADTKATLNYGEKTSPKFLVWEDGDSILLMNGSSRVVATLTSGAGTTSGTFSAPSIPDGDYYAVYPAAAGNYLKSEYGEDTLFVEYPAYLTYNPKTGNVENGGNVMIAKQQGSSSHIQFNNCCSYLHLTITGEETQKVSKVVLEALEDPFLAGQMCFMNIPSDFNDFEWVDNYKKKAVEITFPDGEALSESGLSFNVALAPTCEEGFKATVYLTDESVMELTSGQAFGRNQVITMPPFEFSCE